MNGVRSIFRRKGYLLTALAAAVLLAASSGTAWAQVADINLKSVSVDGADAAGVVLEGTATNVTVVLNKSLPVGATANATIAIVYPNAAGSEFTGEADAKGNAEDGDDSVDNVNDIVLATMSVLITGGRDRGSAQVIFADDLDAVDEKFGISATNLTVEAGSSAGATAAVNITPKSTPLSGKIDDDEDQTYLLRAITSSELIKENSPFDVSLRADPARPGGAAAEQQETVKVYLRADAEGYSVADSDGNSATTKGVALDTSATLTVTTPPNDRNREDDTVTLTGFTGIVVASQRIVSQSYTVLDLHKLPAADAISAEAKDMKTEGTTVTAVEEGGEVYVWVTLENTDKDQVSDTEAFTVALSAANPGQTGDFRNSPNSFVVTGGRGLNNKKTVGPFKLEALEDQDVGMETLMLSLDVTGAPANGPGSSSGAFSIDIEDKTMKQVEPKTEAEAYPKIEDALEAGSGDEGFNPGESFSVMTSDLFTVADGYDARYGVSVSGDAVSVSASSDTVTVDAKKAGTSKVTITATAEMEASSFLPEQTVASMASITFEVTVVDKMLAVMLEMPANVMDGNIVEGMSYDIKVVANRMVTEDTEVMIMRDRAGSDAGEDDYSVSMATIMAGYDSATAELMVTEDDMPDGGTDDNMGETLVLFGMVNGEQINALTFTIWDQAVPTLPLIAQLLLALFLMAGGARLYRRRQGQG